MLKKFLSLALAALLVQVVCTVPALARSQQDKDAELAAKMKAKILEQGVGSKTYVKVRLKNRTEVKGNIYKVNEDDFIVADKKTDEKTTIAFADVEQVKGKGLSTGAKIGLGVAIGVAVFATILAVSLKDGLFGR